MTVKELIEVLSAVEDQEVRVALSQDAEGNSIRWVSDADLHATYADQDGWELDGLIHPDDLAEYLDDYRDDELEGVVVIWPVN